MRNDFNSSQKKGWQHFSALSAYQIASQTLYNPSRSTPEATCAQYMHICHALQIDFSYDKS
jgi:hypothetical protein